MRIEKRKRGVAWPDRQTGKLRHGPIFSSLRISPLRKVRYRLLSPAGGISEALTHVLIALPEKVEITSFALQEAVRRGSQASFLC